MIPKDVVELTSRYPLSLQWHLSVPLFNLNIGYYNHVFGELPDVPCLEDVEDE